MSGISPHPLAELIPAMTDDEFFQLVADIQEHGLREPITLYEGLVLDGRHRAKACDQLGIEPEARVFDGSDPVAFVLSANLHRRHLTTGQRGMVAAKLATLKDGQRADLARASGEGGPIGPPSSSAEAGALLKVGQNTVKRAKTVRQLGTPDLVAAVESGEIAVAPAAEIARRPPEEQAQAMEERRETKRAERQRKNDSLTETERQKQLALAAHRKLAAVMATLAGFTQGLPKLRVDAAIAVAKPTDIQQWIEGGSEAVSALRRLISQLKEAAC